MTRSTALGMLRVGNTGEEILQILDVIVADIESEKTINEIAEILFWEWYLGGHKIPPFLYPYIQDWVKKVLKKALKMAFLCLYRSWEYLSEIYSGGYSEGLRSYFGGSFYSQLNVLRPCDLCPQAITHSQKCQDPADKFFQGLTTQKYQSLL